MPRLDHVTHWVFDLDNTLYPASSNLFAQIDVKMGAFIGDLLKVDAVEARRVQKDFLMQFGTTLRGLMHHHGVAPEDFLSYVHDIDFAPLAPDPALAQAISKLPGRKLVYTNADRPYAERVLERIGLSGHFDGMFDIVDAGYEPKPTKVSFERFFEAHGVDPTKAAMFEDMARNLKPAHDAGMTTIWVKTDSPYAMVGAGEPHIHHETDDLTRWLTDLVAKRGEKDA